MLDVCAEDGNKRWSNNAVDGTATERGWRSEWDKNAIRKSGGKEMGGKRSAEGQMACVPNQMSFADYTATGKRRGGRSAMLRGKVGSPDTQTPQEKCHCPMGVKMDSGRNGVAVPMNNIEGEGGTSADP